MIAQHAGPIFLLALPDDVAEDTATLAAYDLAQKKGLYTERPGFDIAIKELN